MLDPLVFSTEERELARLQEYLHKTGDQMDTVGWLPGPLLDRLVTRMLDLLDAVGQKTPTAGQAIAVLADNRHRVKQVHISIDEIEEYIQRGWWHRVPAGYLDATTVPGPDKTVVDAPPQLGSAPPVREDRASNFVYGLFDDQSPFVGRTLEEELASIHAFMQWLTGRALVRGYMKAHKFADTVNETYPMLRPIKREDVAEFVSEGGMDISDAQEFVSALYRQVPGAMQFVSAMIDSYCDIVRASRDTRYGSRDLPVIQEPRLRVDGAKRLGHRMALVYKTVGNMRYTARAFHTGEDELKACLQKMGLYAKPTTG